MIMKLLKDHKLITSPTCGQLREIITAEDYPYLSIAVAHDIKETKAHYHNGFEEIYFVLDGYVQLKLYDPASEKLWTQYLTANELIIIDKEVHHQVIGWSVQNRLCVLCIPHFDISDEHLSDRI